MVLIIDFFVPSGRGGKKKPAQPQQQPLSKKDKKAKKQQDKSEKVTEKVTEKEKTKAKLSDDDFSDIDKDALNSQSEGNLRLLKTSYSRILLNK